MESAFRAWQVGSLAQLQEMLVSQVPTANDEDLRGFEWRFLDARCKENLLASTAPNEIQRSDSVAFSPDGKHLAIMLRWRPTAPRHCHQPHGYTEQRRRIGQEIWGLRSPFLRQAIFWWVAGPRTLKSTCGVLQQMKRCHLLVMRTLLYAHTRRCLP